MPHVKSQNQIENKRSHDYANTSLQSDSFIASLVKVKKCHCAAHGHQSNICGIGAGGTCIPLAPLLKLQCFSSIYLPCFSSIHNNHASCFSHIFGFGIWCRRSVVGLPTKYRGLPDRHEGKAEYLGLLMTRALVTGKRLRSSLGCGCELELLGENSKIWVLVFGHGDS